MKLGYAAFVNERNYYVYGAPLFHGGNKCYPCLLFYAFSFYISCVVDRNYAQLQGPYVIRFLQLMASIDFF